MPAVLASLAVTPYGNCCLGLPQLGHTVTAVTAVLCDLAVVNPRQQFPQGVTAREADSEILGKHRQKKKPWITAEVLDLCDKGEN